MKDSFGSNVQLATLGPAIAGSRSGWVHGERWPATLYPAALAAVLICSVHAAVAGANTEHAAAIGYLCFSLVLLGCAPGFFARARATQGTVRIRWALMAAGVLASGLGFLSSFTEIIFRTGPARLVQAPCFNASEALFLLSIVLFASGADRSIAFVDTLQALLFVVLRFNLVYSAATRDHFNHNHLLISQLMALFLFLAAMVACVGAASRPELKLLRTLTWFFGLRLLAYFTSDQVSYIWLRHVQCSPWDVPGTVLLAGFAVYLFATSRRATAEDRVTTPLHPPSVMVRSLMPSFLALVNLMLGLFVLRASPQLAASAIALSLICYALRTALLQSHSVKEKALLESRNEQLEGLAVRDPLTGIGNRRSLAGVYGRLRASAASETLALLVLDIDRFKQANDNHGHLYGDEVLVVLARKLESLAAAVPGGHCARLGGDEFALLLPGVSLEEASVLGDELRRRFGSHAFKAASGTVSLSIGVASLREARELPLETLISYADDALYRAKLLGRNRIEIQPVWEPYMAETDAAAPPLRVPFQESAR